MVRGVMDFIDWCDHVLDKLIELTAASVDARNMGVDADQQLAAALFGDEERSTPEFHGSKARLGTYDALHQLTDCYLAEERHGTFYKPTDVGEQVAKDKTELWQEFCSLRSNLNRNRCFVLSTERALTRQTVAVGWSG